MKLFLPLSLLFVASLKVGAVTPVDSTAHRVDTVMKTVNSLPDRYYRQVDAKTQKMAATVNKRSLDAVSSMLEKEKKMQAKLGQTDSVAATRIFKHSIDSLQHLQSLLKSKMAFANKAMSYNSYLDSLSNSLGFIKQLKGGQKGLDGAVQSVNGLENQFAAADQVKNYLQSQKDFLNAQLSSYSNLAGDLKGINKEAYYYTQQLNEYKELLHNKKKAEAKAVSMLQQLPAYKAFLQKHSQLASLFNLSANGDANLAQSLEGLQTRSAVEQILNQRLGGAAGGGGSAALSAQMDAARQQFDQLKNKFPGLDNAGQMPNFQPKDMKSKSLRQRLEFGANVQFQKSSQYFPTTGDFAGQVAYKFSKKGSAGIGVAYKLGMGSGFKDIRFSSQGLGLRSFLDWQIKGSIYVNGGFEENYNATFGSAGDLRRFRNWTGSALAGISKKYQINAKMKGNVMLLYDFLWAVHNPTTQPLVLRMGYTF